MGGHLPPASREKACLALQNVAVLTSLHGTPVWAHAGCCAILTGPSVGLGRATNNLQGGGTTAGKSRRPWFVRSLTVALRQLIRSSEQCSHTGKGLRCRAKLGLWRLTKLDQATGPSHALDVQLTYMCIHLLRGRPEVGRVLTRPKCDSSSAREGPSGCGSVDVQPGAKSR